ncbi:MAG: hypothetical protein GQ562_08845 [Anaerolineales bacterium]|nr:hypothetical protein [Anaerolineales bacterium]
MSAQISMKDLEKSIFQKSFQDGLIDIQIGCVVLMFAIAPLLSSFLGDFWSSMVFLPFWALIYLGVKEIRKKIIQPRVGVVEIGKFRKTRQKKLLFVILVFNLLALILGVLSFFNFADLPGWIHPVRFSAVILMGFSLAGYMLEFPHLYLYGILIALAPLFGEFLYFTYHVPHHGFPITFGITSALIILNGLGIFLRLLKAHPDISPEGLE